MFVKNNNLKKVFTVIKELLFLVNCASIKAVK